MRSLCLFDLAFLAPKGTPPQNIPGDDFESYTDGALLNGLDGGWCGDNVYDICWDTPWTARSNFAALQSYDDFDEYADGANLAGLTGGTGFSGAYAVR